LVSRALCRRVLRLPPVHRLLGLNAPRLALVIAYLEDRPYYVFDEWAADQDPEYKGILYCKLLPEFRNRGRGVVVITHDDRYFHLGTRVMKLQNGQMVDTSSRPSAAEIQAVSAAAAR
jgi:putative ATP-binding cassette transporter